jgi:hypothetical protein
MQPASKKKRNTTLTLTQTSGLQQPIQVYHPAIVSVYIYIYIYISSSFDLLIQYSFDAYHVHS